MTSRRGLRRKQCDGKVRYATREAALPAAVHLHLNVYPCGFCKSYHLGHQPARVRGYMRARGTR